MPCRHVGCPAPADLYWRQLCEHHFGALAGRQWEQLADPWKVDGAAVAALIRMLQIEYGASVGWVAVNAGVARSTAYNVLAGRERVMRSVLDRVESVVRRVGVGDLHPGGVAAAVERKRERDRRRMQREAVAA